MVLARAGVPSRAPGDVVHVAPATYAAQFRPATSGTTDAPIVFKADGAVTISAPAGTVSVMLVGVHDVVLRGMTVLASAPQAVWVDTSSRVTLDGVTVTNSGGAGVQIKGGTSVTVTNSRLVGNARAGFMEMAQAVGTTLSRSTVTGNGKDGQQYNGDGVGLNGTGGSVVDDTISDNGDGVGFEHGIYAGPTANGYLIARNVIGSNAGADVKAAGGPGVVEDNRLTSSMFGLVISDNPVFVTAAVQPRPGALPARDPDHDRHDRGARAALEQHRAADGSLDRRAAMPRRSSSSAPRNWRCATTSSPTRTPTCSAPRSCSTTRRSSAPSSPTRTGTRARIRASCAWPGTAHA